MRVVVLGASQQNPPDSWRDDLALGCRELGWETVTLPARGIPTGLVERACRGADMLIWARMHGHDPAGDATAMLRRIEERGTATVGLHLDLYWTLRGREPRVGNQPWWTSQFVFTADGGPESAARFAERGVNHHWCPPPVGVRWLGRAELNSRYAGQVVFVGGYVAGIHGEHRKRLLEWARRRFGRRFRWYGRPGDRVVGDELSVLYASAHAVIGDSAPAPYYWSDRVPRTLGRAGLLAHPLTPGLDEVGLSDDLMIRYERFNFDELGDRIDSLTEKERREMTDRALTVIAERHTWPVRLREIKEIVFGADV